MRDSTRLVPAVTRPWQTPPQLARRLSVLLKTAERIERQREPVFEREGCRAR
jgi:hypothetical protein